MTSEPVLKVLTALPKARKEGVGWEARCPAHDDREASLSIGEGRDGRALLRCHAGCKPEAIVAALELKMTDLFPRADRTRIGKKIVAAYDYNDADGKLQFQVVRFAPKDFRQRRPDGKGGWDWNLNGAPRVLYRLPQLITADAERTVFITEGEKDADKLVALGLVATTNPGGAAKWLPAYASVLKNRRVAILPDNDAPGREHAIVVADSLDGSAREVRIVVLPGLSAKGDVSDWLESGHTVEELKALVRRTPVRYAITDSAAESREGRPVHSSLAFKTARELGAETPEQVAWLVEGQVAAGCITELDGKPKLAGKTTYLAHMVRAKLSGARFLGYQTKAGPVLWLTEERSATFRDALEQAGLLECDDLHVLTWPDTYGTEWPNVVAKTREHAKAVKADTLIVDTLPSFAKLRGDAENNAGAAAEAMEPIMLAAADGLGVVVARHDRRAGGEVGESGRGSTAFTGSVDIVLHLSRLGGQGRENARQLDGIGRLRAIPDRLVIELTANGYQAVGTETDLKLQEARRLLLEALPDAEEDAVSLASLLRAGDSNGGRPAGPLSDSHISKGTYQGALRRLANEGRVCQKKLGTKKVLFWLANDYGAISQSSDGAPRPTSGEILATPPSHKGVANYPTQGQPPLREASVNAHEKAIPDADLSWLEEAAP